MCIHSHPALVPFLSASDFLLLLFFIGAYPTYVYYPLSLTPQRLFVLDFTSKLCLVALYIYDDHRRRRHRTADLQCATGLLIPLPPGLTIARYSGRLTVRDIRASTCARNYKVCPSILPIINIILSDKVKVMISLK